MRIWTIRLMLIVFGVVRLSVLPVAKAFLESWFNTFLLVSR